ncbi:MAG TPA: dTDP-4-dehydrorhamnose reductase [Dehalococcoidia bacterium]|nr:dTDP-4-dehydrorhamnose reductase [Dehalococcoidia bacterium]
MRILITGATGQLGQAMQSALASDEIAALGHDELDITDALAVRRALAGARPEVVVHAAAWTDTAGCERDPERAMLVNGRGAGIVAEACREAGAAMVYVSSNEVFDGQKGSPYDEDDATNAVNAYAASKLEGERQVAAALEARYIVRTSWLYGLGRVSFPEKILQAARRDGKLRAVTDEIASPTWTVDLAEAISKLVRTGAYGVYHFSNAGWCSRLEWAAEILRLAGMTGVPVEAGTMADFDLPYQKPPFTAIANNNGARLGITLRPWQEALADHLRGVSAHPTKTSG